MATRTEMIAEALMDLLAYARGCRHDDHDGEDRKKCMAVAEAITETIRVKIDAHESDSDFHPYRE
jgi:hypothetical protein